MPLPAWLVGFVVVNVGSSVIHDMLNPDRTADSDLDSVYPDRPKPINPDNPRSNPNVNLPTQPIQRPTVYFPPIRIYEIPIQGQNAPPELPPRRLPVEGDNQTGFQTPIGDVFTIQEWIKHREFGKLLWNPLKEEPLIIRQGMNRDADAQFNEAVRQGVEGFQRWLYAQLDPEYKQSDEYLDQYSFWDGTAWVMPKQLKGLQGDLSVGFGMKALQRLGEVMSLQSSNCFFGIIDCIPNGYEVRHADFPETEQLTGKLNDLELIGNQVINTSVGVNHFPVLVPKDLTGLPSFEEFKRAGIDDRRLDNASFDSKSGNRFNVETEGLTAEDLEGQLSDAYKERYYDTLESVTEYIAWQSKQMEALLGAFPVEIEIEDVDLVTEGKQTEKIILPNISETLVELMGNSINQEKYIDVLININLRLMLELASVKSVGTVNNAGIESIVDYLGFAIKRKEKEVDFTFNPALETEEGKELELTEFLEPTKIKIKVEEYDDDVTLEMQLQELREAAKIIKGALTRKVDLDNNKGLKSLFQIGLDVLEGKVSEDDKTKIDEWLEKFEDGFTNEPYIKDPVNPWGKSRSQRPRIRKLGDND